MTTISISRDISQMIYDDGLEAYQSSSHPCRHLIQWQIDKGITNVRMPEPFSGEKSTLGICFLGLNPSISAVEESPSFLENISFEKYDSYFRNRFDAKNRDTEGFPLFRLIDGSCQRAKIWTAIERLGSCYVQDGFKLGTHAILTQAVPYKTTNGWLGNSDQAKRVLQHSKKFTSNILNTPNLKVVVPMGSAAWEQLLTVLKFFDVRANALKITEAMGMRFKAETSQGNELYVVPIKHMSYPAKKDIQIAVGDHILSSLSD
jgi:hypothetical protein